MEHTKKMILVPQDFFTKLNNQKDEKTGLTNDLDSEMKSLLENSKIGEREKWAKYQQTLQRYLHFKEKERQPLKVTMEETKEEDTDGSTRLQRTTIQNEIVDAVPKMFRKRAQLLIHRLESSNNISWDQKGEVVIKEKKLPGSNITDLVSDVIRSRKTSNPHGWQEFSLLLKELNVPREFIGNPRRLTYMDRETVSPTDRPVIAKPYSWARKTPKLTRSTRGDKRNRSMPSSEEETRISSWERYHL